MHCKSLWIKVSAKCTNVNVKEVLPELLEYFSFKRVAANDDALRVRYRDIPWQTVFMSRNQFYPTATVMAVLIMLILQR